MNNVQLLLSLASEPWAVERGHLRSLIRILAIQAFNAKAGAGDVEAKITQKRELEVQRAAGAVAVLPIYGLIAQRMSFFEQMVFGGTSIERTQAIFRGLVADDQIKAIVLNFDSPGGSPNGCDEFALEIFEARGTKPIVAQIDSGCASAAYYLASQADEIVITPGGIVGSVGVYAIHEEMSKLFEQLGVTYTLISSGGVKGKNNDFTPLTEDVRAELEKRVAYTDGLFRKAVARGRSISQAAVTEKFGNGDMFTPAEAVANGMVDKIAPLKDTLARFGAAAPSIGRAAISSVRAAAAAGDFTDIPPSTIEAAMREALGLTKSQGAACAGRVLKMLRQGDPDEDRGDPGQAQSTAASSDLIASILASAGSYSNPTRKT
jgi:signal peptide peptidase SppA